jgi:hypothetical protein
MLNLNPVLGGAILIEEAGCVLPEGVARDLPREKRRAA